MTVATLVLVTILVFFLIGYRFNKTDGKFEQGGLVQYDSQPSGARVSLDGRSGSNTPAKATINTGMHEVTMSKSGYIDWKKSIDLHRGELLWLNYTRLIPENLEPKSASDPAPITSSAASPDAKLYAVYGVETNPSLTLYSIDSDSNDRPKSARISIPSDIYTASSDPSINAFSIKRWSPSSQYILVRHTYQIKDKTQPSNEWLLIDKGDQKRSKNITQLFGAETEQLEFVSDDKNVVYGLVGGSVYRLNFESETRSRPLVDNVTRFTAYGDSLFFYVTNPKETIEGSSVEIGYYTKNASFPRVLRSVPSQDADQVLADNVAYGQYYRDDYVAISSGTSVDILKGSLPKSDDDTASALTIYATIQTKQPVTQLSSMTSGRFFYIQTGSNYTVYDLELTKVTSMQFDPVLNLKRPDGKIKWLDSYHMLTYDQSDESKNTNAYTLSVQEFDGANKTQLGNFIPTQAVTLSPSGKYLYGITGVTDNVDSNSNTSNTDTHELTRIQLKL